MTRRGGRSSLRRERGTSLLTRILAGEPVGTLFLAQGVGIKGGSADRADGQAEGLLRRG